MSPNWNVTVKLNDGTDTVDADLSDKVKKQYVLQLRKWVKTKNKSLKRVCGMNVCLVHIYVFLNIIPVIWDLFQAERIKIN